MPVARARFVPNHGPTGMGGQMMSGETADLAEWAGRQVVFAALGISPRTSGDYAAHFEVVHDVQVIDGNPRRSSVVVNDSDHAAAVEFGSGRENEGMTGPGERPQGGWNRPARVLARAGDMVGEYQDRERLG